MSLLSQLQDRKDDDRVAERLFTLANDLRDKIVPHLKQIIAQLPEFDLHDEVHSAAVISNMEALVADKFPLLSSYELFLLFVSAYVHDLGMALPDPEYQLIELTEGSDSIGGCSAKLAIRNDLKPPWKLAAAVHFISRNASDLYGSFESVKDWPFACSDENTYREDLAKRLVAYQVFRNGYATQLRTLQKDKDAEGYQYLSKQIRCDFIRETHHTRAETYARNLGELFEERLGGAWGDALAADLGRVCRSHGESGDYALGLDYEVTYLGGQTTNLAFVAVLLRVADVMHYSYDRAPSTLLGEKMFHSVCSFKHWAVKNEGVNVSIEPSADTGMRQISYRAFCREPEYYYVLHSYMDAVDRELALLMHGVHDWRHRLEQKKPAGIYDLCVNDHVLRSGVRPDNTVFTPKQGLSFSLDQRRVLELLTGVGLYKDKYACIRELYQNALDACRCMLASKNSRGDHAQGRIEFGLGEINGVGGKEKCLYCCDNGIGMTQDVVEKHLLNVGNSYYVSTEFQRASVAWGNTFTPTSQFGIGILSAFMIGRRIEITSVAMGSDGGSQMPIRFSIGGLHEQFYYMTPDPFDLERIGPHGTIVRVFLKNEEAQQISSDHPHNVALMLHAGQSGAYRMEHEVQMAEWERSLFKKVSDYVAVAHDRIEVSVRSNDDTASVLLDRVLPFGLGTANLTLDDLVSVDDCERRLRTRLNCLPIREIAGNLKTISLRITCEGVEFHGLVNLPRAGFSGSDPNALGAIPMLRCSSILVDGIDVQRDSSHEKPLLSGLISMGTLNFTGQLRPQLSVDRTNITEWPPETEGVMKKLIVDLVAHLRAMIREHMAAEQLDQESSEVRLIWEYIFKTYWFCRGQLIASLVSDHEKIPLRDIEALTGGPLTIGDFAAQETITLRGLRFQDLSSTAKILLLGKMVKASKMTVTGSTCQIQSTTFVLEDAFFDEHQFRERHIVIKADEWIGECAEFDIYSPVWPVISSSLFDVYGKNDRWEPVILLTERAKKVAHYGNSITALSEQDPVMIHPTMGIYHLDEPLWRQEKVQNNVYKFDKAAAKFWLSEINDPQDTASPHQRYVLAVYLAPRQLSEAEIVSLKQYTVKDPVYVKGAQEGWSILVLGGRECNTVILPGRVTRRELVESIPDHIWTAVCATSIFLDGSPLTAYRTNVTGSVDV